MKNKATEDELRDLVAAAETAGVGKGDLESVIRGVYNFATNGRVKPIDRLTSKQCADLAKYFRNKAVELERRR